MPGSGTGRCCFCSTPSMRARRENSRPLSTVLECFGTSRDEAVGEAVVSVLRKSPSALTTLGEDRLKRLLAGYPEKVQRDSEPLFQQLRDAQRERIEKLQKLEPLLSAGGDVG